MFRIKLTRPRTREDWTFYFQLFGFIGNIIFFFVVFVGGYGRAKTPEHNCSLPHDRIILIDSTVQIDTLVIHDSETSLILY